MLRRLITTGAFGLAGVLAGCAFVLERDAKKRRNSEAALRESEHRYRQSVESNADITWTADPRGEVIKLNEPWHTFAGLSHGNSPAPNWLAARHLQDRTSIAEAWKLSLETGRPLDIEHRIRLEGGGYRWMRTRAYPRRAQNGEILKWHGSTEDISDRKQAEIELL